MINPHGSHAVAAALYRFNHSLKKIRYLQAWSVRWRRGYSRRTR